MTSEPILPVFLSALLLSAVVTPAVRRLCLQRAPQGLRSQPRLGGVAIAIAFVLPLIVLFAGAGETSADVNPMQLSGIGIAALTVLGLGIYDDLREASPIEKLGVQLVIALSTWNLGVRIEAFTSPLGGSIELATWASMSLTGLWLVGMMNAVNLIDGLDGLAAGVSLIGVSTLLLFGWMDGHVLLCLVSSALAGALLGFLFYNFNPATIFMGDSGSQFLGYILAVVSILSTSKQSTAWALLLPVLALGLPIADTLLAIVRRVRGGQSITSPDTWHVHHRLLRAGYSHRQSVLLLYGVCIALAAIAWTLKASHDLTGALNIAGTGLVIFGIIHLVGFPKRLRAQVHLQTAGAAVLQRPLASRNYTRAIRHAGSMDELWSQTEAALKTIGTLRATLEIYTNPSFSAAFETQTPHSERTRERTTYLKGPHAEYGQLTARCLRTADPQHDWQTDLQLELIAEALIDALEQIAPRHELIVRKLGKR